MEEVRNLHRIGKHSISVIEVREGGRGRLVAAAVLGYCIAWNLRRS